MKKHIITLVAVLAVVVMAVAYADGFDFSSMSNDDIIALRLAAFQELMDRGAVKSANVPAGTYTVGTDIPAGDYSISTTQMLVTIVVNEYDQMYVVTPENGVGKITISACTSGEKTMRL